MAVENLEQARLSRLEGAYEQVDCWLNDMNSRLDGMQQAIDGLRAEIHGLRAETQQAIDGLRAETNSRFGRKYDPYYTLLVVIAASWVTLMAAMITTLFIK
ncbi:MAG: hypothetical protein OXU67_04455 [Chloroflexota bacterium]|nr:hypothetical protein [Chloroflexota bacterium]